MEKQERFVIGKAIAISREQFLVLGAFVSFGLSFFIGGPQILVGSIVNGLIIWAGFNYPLKSAFSIIILPSLGALSRGALFGGETVFLYYFVPFIWIGNLLLFFTVKKMSNKYILGLLGGGGVKAGFLYLSALAFYKGGIVPVMFLKNMGISQFFTALIGGGLIYLLFKAKSE